jgi:hydrogenase maturation protease
MNPSLVLGVGNSFRGDDGAGPAVARLLRRDPPPGVEVRECPGELTPLIDVLEGRERVILIDAARGDDGGGAPGRIHRLDAARRPLPAALFAGSTHDLGLAAAVELLRAEGRLPPEVVVYAIEGEAYGFGEGLAPQVERAVEAVAECIRVELSAPG